MPRFPNMEKINSTDAGSALYRTVQPLDEEKVKLLQDHFTDMSEEGQAVIDEFKAHVTDVIGESKLGISRIHSKRAGGFRIWTRRENGELSPSPLLILRDADDDRHLYCVDMYGEVMGLADADMFTVKFEESSRIGML